MINERENKKEFNQGNIIENLRGIDKTVYDYIIDEKLMSKEALKVTFMEMSITNETFKSLVIRNGFVKQAEITDLILKLRPSELMDEQFVEPSVPYEVLSNNKIMLCAVTDSTVFLSTSHSESVAKKELQKYFPRRDFYFIPSNVSKLQLYLSKVKRITNKDSNFIEKIIREAIREGASDIHIDPELKGYTIHFRNLGLLKPIGFGDEPEYYKNIAIIKAKCGLDIAEKSVDQDGQYSVEFNGRNIDLRIVTIPSSYGKETIVIRILDPDRVQTNLTTLGITHVENWRKAISLKNGLCLICGETGSGKTTTLNSSIREMDRFTKKIFTIEDPVEYNISNVAQINVKTNTGMTFGRALKACMRGDPDVIVVGEVRDEETARNMIKAAETGHLVIATLHTGTLRGAINRLRDIGINPNELRNILKSVMVQSLIRVSCDKCNGKGCDFCSHIGYVSRTVISENVYLSTQEEIDNFLNDRIDPWWQTKEQDAYEKYKKGITTKVELERVFGEEIKRIFKLNGETF